MRTEPCVTVTGDPARPARLAVSALRGRPQHRPAVTFECATSGPRRHRFAGPLLHDVLGACSPGFDRRGAGTGCGSRSP